MSFSFIGTIKEKSLDVEFSSKPLIHSLPLLKYDWINYLSSIEAPANLIEQLNNLDTHFIVTGQQIGFLNSPILTLYKAITTEILASEVSRSTNKTCLPIFWLQTEDHDLEEISTANIITANRELHTIKLQSSNENRTPVGDLPVANYIQGLNFEGLNLPDEIDQMVLDSVKKESLSKGFAYLYYKLFPDSQIILFDPRSLNVTAHTSEIYNSLIQNPNTIHNLLREKYTELRGEGIDPPIKVDKDRSLFFHSSKNSDRYRLNFKDNKFYLDGEEISVESLEQDLKSNPKNFSSSALLRPLLQDYLFSPLAYIGGSTELLYHRQITPLYSYFNLRQPQLIERAQGVILETKSSKWWEESFKLPKLFFSHLTDLVQSLRKENFNSNEQLLLKDRVLGKAKEIEEMLESKIALNDKTLESPLNKTIRSINDSLEKLLNKYQESCLRFDTTNEERISRTTQITHPNNILQERTISAVSVLTLLGENGFKLIKENLNELIAKSIIIRTK